MITLFDPAGTADPHGHRTVVYGLPGLAEAAPMGGGAALLLWMTWCVRNWRAGQC